MPWHFHRFIHQWHGRKCQRHCGFPGRNTEQKVACPHFSDVLSPFQEYRPYNAPTEFTAPWRNIHNSQHVKEHPWFLAEDQHDLVEHLLALYDQRAVTVDLIYLLSPSWSTYLVPPVPAMAPTEQSRTGEWGCLFLLIINMANIQSISDITDTSKVKYLRCTLNRWCLKITHTHTKP